MDVEAEAVYVDILRSLQSSILNSASVSNITNTVMNYRYSVSNPADSDPDPVLIRVTCYGILGLQGAFVQKAKGPRLAYPPYERKNKVTVGACPR